MQLFQNNKNKTQLYVIIVQRGIIMTIALFAGSFDPITNGHIDVLNQALKVFDKVIIVVGYNSEKQSFLSVEDRVELIKACVKNYSNVEVESYNGLTVNYAKTAGAEFLIRGIRSTADYEYEIEMAQINKELNPEIQTIFFMPNIKNKIISSSMIRELISHKADISDFVPEEVNKFFATCRL